MSQIIQMSKLERLALSIDTPKKKVLLIDGNTPYFNDEKGYFFGSTNFGIHRLSGYLNNFGIETDIVRVSDFKSKDSLLEKIESYDIIGISALSPAIDNAIKIGNSIKEAYPEKMIVGGAEHFALDYRWILENTGFDICCTSQGEIPLLALALNVKKEEVGSIAYKKSGNETLKNDYFERLSETSIFKVGRPIPAKEMNKDWMHMIFPELKEYFEFIGSTQTGSGCQYKCGFCTNNNFLGNDYVNTLETSRKEIDTLHEQGIDFVFVRDAMMNPSKSHLDGIVMMMNESNRKYGKHMGWFGFMSAKKDYEESDFKKMSDAGCVMVGVGIEDPINREAYGKGGNIDVATEFVSKMKEHLLVRGFMMIGSPEHYNNSREEIKDRFLIHMKAHPQAAYRLNIFTPMVGTSNFEEYFDSLEINPRENVSSFKKYDTMHSVINPEKMYSIQNAPKEKRWVKKADDWMILKNEIMKEYLTSFEHVSFVERIKSRNIIQYGIAKNFMEINLKIIDQYK